MKNNIILIVLVFSLILVGCKLFNDSTYPHPITVETVVTKEVTQQVTRVIYIVQTTTPSPLWGPTATRPPSCYDTAFSQYGLNQCAWSLAQEVKKELDKLVNRIAEMFSHEDPPKKEEFLQLESEWELLADKECSLWWGGISESGGYEYGSMAPMIVGGCLQSKYEERIKELNNLYEE